MGVYAMERLVDGVFVAELDSHAGVQIAFCKPQNVTTLLCCVAVTHGVCLAVIEVNCFEVFVKGTNGENDAYLSRQLRCQIYWYLGISTRGTFRYKTLTDLRLHQEHSSTLAHGT